MWLVKLFKYKGQCFRPPEELYDCTFFQYTINALSPFVGWNYLLYLIVGLSTLAWALSVFIYWLILKLKKRSNLQR